MKTTHLTPYFRFFTMGWSFFKGKRVGYVQFVQESVTWRPHEAGYPGSPDGPGPTGTGTMKNKAGEARIDNGAGIPYNPKDPNGHWVPQDQGGGVTDHPGSGLPTEYTDRQKADFMWRAISGMVDDRVPDFATELTWTKEFWTYVVSMDEPRQVLGYWYWYSATTVTKDPPKVTGDNNGKKTPEYYPVGRASR